MESNRVACQCLTAALQYYNKGQLVGHSQSIFDAYGMEAQEKKNGDGPAIPSRLVYGVCYAGKYKG